MNVALVHRRFTEHGGTERFLVGLARFLRDRGHEVHVYCNEVRPDLCEEPGLRFHPLPMLRLGQLAKLLSLWWSSGRVRQGGHDVVMGFGRTRGHDVFRAGGGAHAVYLERCRPLWRLSPLAWIERALDRAAVRAAQVVVSPSALAGADLVSRYGLEPGRLRVVPNGVDSQRFQLDSAARARARESLGLGEGPVLCFLGTGFARKGLGEAVAVARNLGYPLVVIGRDRHIERWRARFPEVRFLGAVTEPEALLPAMDVLLLPTRYEPYGNVCLEAAACGVVPVTTPRNGVIEVLEAPELVGEGVHGLTVATRRAIEGGEALKLRMVSRARALPRESAYLAVEKLFSEVV